MIITTESPVLLEILIFAFFQVFCILFQVIVFLNSYRKMDQGKLSAQDHNEFIELFLDLDGNTFCSNNFFVVYNCICSDYIYP